MRALISGGFGFLGTHLIEHLLEQHGPDVEIHVVDNLSTNPIPHERFLDEIGHPAAVTFTIGEIADFCATTSDRRWDVIYHLASVVGPAGVLKHAGDMAYLIVRDCREVARFATACGARLVDISTSEIYGGGREGLCLESYARIITANYSARLEYAVGKLASEVSLFNLTQTTPLHASIVRPFNIAGPRQSGRGGFVLPRFIGQALTGRDLTVFGDGSQVRAFTHVRDLVDGIALAGERGVNGRAYNLGNRLNKCTILQLAEDVRAIVNPKAEIKFIDPKALYGPLFEEANDKYPDATLAIEELGWAPKYSIKETIRQTAGYMSALSPEDLVGMIGSL